MKLSDLHNNEAGYIVSIDGSLAFRTRLEEMGFMEGQLVRRDYGSPFDSPAVYIVMGERIALRHEEAKRITLSANAPQDLEEMPLPLASALTAEERLATVATHCHDIDEAVETGEGDNTCATEGCGGCPSCAPSKVIAPKAADELTIALVGNPNCGKTAFFNAASGGHERTGNYAGVTVTSIVGQTTFEGQRLRIVDLPGTYSLRAFSPEEAYVAHELERGEVDAIINVLDATNLERNLLLTLQLKDFGIPVVGVLNMHDEFEKSGSVMDKEALSERLGMPLVHTVASRRRGIDEALRQAVAVAKMGKATPNLQAIRRSKVSNKALNARIRAILSGVYERREGKLEQLTHTWDKWLVRRPIAYFFFFLIMWVIFQATFKLGQYPMDWIDNAVAWLQQTLQNTLPDGFLQDLFVEGILGGVGAVIVFFPNILILYFLISLLEDSGYLARAATLADPLLNKAGLHGKSFIPMLMGFGCNVPAVMATRTIESRKARLLTMTVVPFMSCSARIPVYLIFAGAFFPQQAGTVIFCLYMLGIVVAILSAIILSKVLKTQGHSHFVLAIPPYRRPMLKSVVRHTWERGREYLRKMATVILLASIALWLMNYITVPNPFRDKTATPTAELAQHSATGGERVTVLECIGRTLQPVFAPLGYNWQMTCGVVTGATAKELLVSTLGVLYNIPEDAANADAGVATLHDAQETHLAARIKAEGTTPASGMSFLIFALLYIPCIATIAALKNESGRWKHALFSSAYSFTLAYVLSFIVYQWMK